MSERPYTKAEQKMAKRVAGVACGTLILLVVILLLSTRPVKGDTWTVPPQCWNQPTDSVIQIHRYGSTLSSRTNLGAVYSANPSVTAVDGFLNHLALLFYPEGGSVASSMHFWARFATDSTLLVDTLAITDAYLGDTIALCSTKVFIDGVQSGASSAYTRIAKLTDTAVLAFFGRRTDFVAYIQRDTTTGAVDSQVTMTFTYDLRVDTSAPLVPFNPHSCIVYGYIGDLGGGAVWNATVTLTMTDKGVVNSCDPILMFNRTRTSWTDRNGYFAIEAIWSSCLANKKYKLNVVADGLSTLERDITVPDSTTYKVVW